MYQKDYEHNQGQQLHQYQQNETLHRTLNNWTHQKTTTYGVRNPGRGLRQAHNCGGVEPIYGIPTLPLITGFPTTMQISNKNSWFKTKRWT